MIHHGWWRVKRKHDSETEGKPQQPGLTQTNPSPAGEPWKISTKLQVSWQHVGAGSHTDSFD